MRKNITPELVQKYLNDQCTLDERSAVEEWVQTAQSDDEVLQMMENDWDQLEATKEINRMDRVFFEVQFDILKQQMSVPDAKHQIIRPWMKIAASLFIILSATLLVLNLTPIDDDQWITQYSPNGGPSVYTLSDGSTVTLSSGSSIRYPVNMTESNRSVVLTGEAFFDVPEHSEPLIIYAGNFLAKVRSSSLNISAFEEDEEVRIAVADGQAEISENKQLTPMLKLRFPKTLPLTKLIPAKSVRLENDEYFAMRKSDGSIDQIQDFDQKEVFGWKDGLIYFNNADSIKVFKKLERWYGVDIKISGCVNQNSFSGEFKNKTLEDILTSVMDAPNIKYEISGNDVSIVGRCI